MKNLILLTLLLCFINLTLSIQSSLNSNLRSDSMSSSSVNESKALTTGKCKHDEFEQYWSCYKRKSVGDYCDLSFVLGNVCQYGHYCHNVTCRKCKITAWRCGL